MEIQLATQSYKSDSLPISAQRCINAYAEMQPPGASTRVAVFGSPGLTQFTNVGSGPIRGGIAVNGVAYVVSGSSFYSVNADGTSTLLGGGIIGNANISMDGNSFEIIIVNGTLGWSYLIATASFVQISDPNFMPANTVCSIHDAFAFDIAGTNQFQISNLLDGRTYSTLNRATAESHPSLVLAVANHRGQLLVYTTTDIEIWQNTGAANFAYAPINGALVDKGILAPLASCFEDEGQFYLGNDFVFYRLAGLQKQRISTFALEAEWRSFLIFNDAICFVYTFRGHKFVTLTFPTANRTFVWDIASSLWHERESYDPRGLTVRWRGNCAIDCYGKILIGDSQSGQVGFLDKNRYTEFGNPIITQLVLPAIYRGGLMFGMPRFELDMETGVGAVSGQGQFPQVMLDWSDDGGFTFGAPQLWNSIGTIGTTMTRLQWNGLGSSYERYLRLSISDPVKRVFRGARCPSLFFDEAP